MQGIQSSRIRKRAAAKRKKRQVIAEPVESQGPPAYLERLLSGLEDGEEQVVESTGTGTAQAHESHESNISNGVNIESMHESESRTPGSNASSSSPEPCSTPTNGSASSNSNSGSGSGADDDDDGRMGVKNLNGVNGVNGVNGTTKPESQASAETTPPDVNVIVLLEGANLELTKARNGGMTLLNSDEHAHVLRKSGRNANDARPDITHQCLLTLLDSPLNKAGRLKVYIRTTKNILISVHPSTRIPRTSRRFYGLMAELLSKHKVRGTSGSEPLFRAIKNPITSHLPVGTRRVVCTYNSENIVDIRTQARDTAILASEQSRDNEPGTALYVIGAIAHGKIEEDWSEENICISEYPLSAATVCGRLTFAYECLLNIL